MADSSSKQVQHTGIRYVNLNSFFLPYHLQLFVVKFWSSQQILFLFILQVVIGVGDWRPGDWEIGEQGGREQSEIMCNESSLKSDPQKHNWLVKSEERRAE